MDGNRSDPSVKRRQTSSPSSLSEYQFRKPWQKLLTDRRKVELVFRVMRLNQVVGDLMGQSEVPN